MIQWVQSGGGIRGLFKVVEGGVEWQTGAHPEEHSRAQSVAGRPEVVLAVACSEERKLSLELFG